MPAANFNRKHLAAQCSMVVALLPRLHDHDQSQHSNSFHVYTYSPLKSVIALTVG